MKNFFKKKKWSLGFIAFLQALGMVIYCCLVGLLFWRGETFFGPINIFLGPTMLLVLFVASALISALLILGYPIILFWERKQTIKALKLVIYSTLWLLFFTALIILTLTLL